ncbi:MAG TPA: membrane protein insertase YidC [Afifellaceae bacterium]|nr:membrane protein insertase YidC [Afifellaceae bacterium]
MDNNRNTLLAMALSMAVLFAWIFLVDAPRRAAQQQRQAEIEAQAPGTGTAQAPSAQGGDTSAGANVPAPQGGAEGAAPASNIPGAAVTQPTGQSRAEVVASGERVKIETPSLTGSINLKGGRIDDLLLTKYRETIDPDSPLIELFSPPGSANPYYAEFGWVARGVKTPGTDSLWSADSDVLTPDRPVTLSWDNGEGLVFKRTIAVDRNYKFTLTQSVENNTGDAVTLFPYGLVNRIGRPKTVNFFVLHEGLIGVFGEESLTELDYDDLDDAEPAANGAREIVPIKSTDSGWLGITDKYWASALIPANGTSYTPRFFRSGTDEVPNYQADYLGAGLAVPAGESAGHKVLLFAGAKEVDVINGYEEKDKINRFGLMIDWGWFYFLTKPLFSLIDWLYQLLGNFGLAILGVTVLVKAVFFPLANKSYTSMSRMKKVQPEVKKLQERYKDDQMGMRTAMMELYKKEKINPLSGCWPIMIQIPVFFALYKVLFITIEMRHAPFFGWIRDLAAPDPTSLFNLFGLLPYDVPQFLMIGVWPLLMGITMFVQMQMNPQPPDKTQAMIFTWMPVIFTFMLASFPAGLVIYWAWNNFLSILQQGLIMKRHGVKIELFDNLRSMLGKTKNDPAE